MNLKNRIPLAYRRGAVETFRKKKKKLLKAYLEASLCYVTPIQIQSVLSTTKMSHNCCKISTVIHRSPLVLYFELSANDILVIKNYRF